MSFMSMMVVGGYDKWQGWIVCVPVFTVVMRGTLCLLCSFIHIPVIRRLNCLSWTIFVPTY